MNSVALPIPDAAELGPAMRALNERQRAFVVAFVVMGESATAAARAAGYLDSGSGSIRVIAHRLIHDTRVQAAITEEGARRLKGMMPAALQAVQEIVENPQHKNRLNAAFGVLNRSGLHELIERKEVHEFRREEKIAEIREFAAQLGLDAKQLLGRCIDVEFEEVEPSPAAPDGEPW
jgi:hypothetical protein